MTPEDVWREAMRAGEEGRTVSWDVGSFERAEHSHDCMCRAFVGCPDEDEQLGHMDPGVEALVWLAALSTGVVAGLACATWAIFRKVVRR